MENINWNELMIAEAGAILMFALIVFSLWLIDRYNNLK